MAMFVFGSGRDLGLVLGSDDPLDQLWMRLDADADGSLGRAEVVEMLVAMGRIDGPNDSRGDKVDAVLAELDSDGSGDIDIGEFEDWYRQQVDSTVRAGTVHESVYITQAGAASSKCGVNKGMAILSIQGLDARMMSLRKVAQVIKDAGQPVTLQFDPRPRFVA